MPEPIEHSTEIEVRYVETDQMGVVHHANYLVWLELARTHLCANSGFPYAEIEKLGYILMVTGAELSYRKGAHYAEKIRVTAWIDQLGSRGVHFAYRVERGDELLARGATEHVWVDVSTERVCRTPEPLREPFRKLAGKTQSHARTEG